MWTDWSLVAASLATASVLLVGAAVAFIFKADNKLRHVPGPKPTNFFLGHALETLGTAAKWEETGNFPEPYLSWVQEYGGAIRFRELFSNLIMFTDPKAVQHILASNGTNYPRDNLQCELYSHMSFGPGLLSTNGSLHDKYRKLLNPLFMPSQIKKHIGIFNSQTQRICDLVLNTACETGSPINMIQMFERLTLNIIGLAGFGFDFELDDSACEAFRNIFFDVSPFLMIGLYTIPKFLKLPLPQLKKHHKGQQVLRRMIENVIEKKIQNQMENGNTNKSQDILDLVLENSSTKEAVIHTISFLTAGHETTSTTLSWVFSLLESHPQVVSKIRAEHASVIAKYKALDSPEALAELKYANAVISETLRLNPASETVIQRVCTNDDVVPMSEGEPLFVPAGTSIEIHVATMHRNPKYWHNASEFIPERFIEGTLEYEADLQLRNGKSHAYYYLPFSIGAANCIGQRFALTTMQIVVSTITSLYDFKATPNSDFRHRHNGITVRPANVEMILQRVKSAPEAHDPISVIQ